MVTPRGMCCSPLKGGSVPQAMPSELAVGLVSDQGNVMAVTVPVQSLDLKRPGRSRSPLRTVWPSLPLDIDRRTHSIYSRRSTESW